MYVWYFNNLHTPFNFFFHSLGDLTYPSACCWMVPGTVDPKED